MINYVGCNSRTYATLFIYEVNEKKNMICCEFIRSYIINGLTSKINACTTEETTSL